jgi:hypothetical protein
VPFSSVESGLHSTGPVLAETFLSLSSLTTAVQAFFTLCPQPGQTAPPLTTENFYLLQDWQQEIKAMPADLSEFPACCFIYNRKRKIIWIACGQGWNPGLSFRYGRTGADFEVSAESDINCSHDSYAA